MTNTTSAPAEKATLIYFRQFSGKVEIEDASASPALKYFTEGIPTQTFPSHPGEVGSVVYCEIETQFPYQAYNILNKKIYDTSRYDFMLVMQEVVDTHNFMDDPSKVFTIHAKAVLLRSCRWLLLRKFPSHTASAFFNKLAGKTVDLCEAFHHPSILTYGERQSFSARDIEFWLDFHPLADDPDPESTLLQMFCTRMF